MRATLCDLLPCATLAESCTESDCDVAFASRDVCIASHFCLLLVADHFVCSRLHAGLTNTSLATGLVVDKEPVFDRLAQSKYKIEPAPDYVENGLGSRMTAMHLAARGGTSL